MRQIPIIAAILVAAVLAPVAASADRMWIGFHDDPVLRYDGEKATRHGGCHQDEQGDDPADARDVGQHRADEAGECGRLRTIPAYNFNDLDDFVRNAQSQDAEVLDDGLGNAEVGERQQDAATSSPPR